MGHARSADGVRLRKSAATTKLFGVGTLCVLGGSGWEGDGREGRIERLHRRVMVGLVVFIYSFRLSPGLARCCQHDDRWFDGRFSDLDCAL